MLSAFPQASECQPIALDIQRRFYRFSKQAASQKCLYNMANGIYKLGTRYFISGVQIGREEMTNSASEEIMIQRKGELESRLTELNQERAKIERELHAITLYLDAINDVLPNSEPAAASNSKPEPKGSAGGRARKGERSGAILDLLRQEPDGYTAGKIYELLG